MKFSAREDIEAPLDHVFTQVSDFVVFERRALRQGARITRLDTGPYKIGTTWEVVFKFRGRDRKMVAEIVEFDAPNQYQIESVSDGLSATTNVELVALSRGRTRVATWMDLRAKSLTARLLLQSMKLAKGKLTRRFKARVLEFAEDIEEAFRKGK